MKVSTHNKQKRIIFKLTDTSGLGNKLWSNKSSS